MTSEWSVVYEKIKFGTRLYYYSYKHIYNLYRSKYNHRIHSQLASNIIIENNHQRAVYNSQDNKKRYYNKSNNRTGKFSSNINTIDNSTIFTPSGSVNAIDNLQSSDSHDHKFNLVHHKPFCTFPIFLVSSDHYNAKNYRYNSRATVFTTYFNGDDSRACSINPSEHHSIAGYNDNGYNHKTIDYNRKNHGCIHSETDNDVQADNNVADNDTKYNNQTNNDYRGYDYEKDNNTSHYNSSDDNHPKRNDEGFDYVEANVKKRVTNQLQRYISDSVAWQRLVF
ncbi:PREDICTED: probable serine/threonine-protein kinase DDB_G0283337 [Branchiostoma belcheri]|uniref:Probable serine/threonine-protein kinase DDB_G0283337 n=1 Tax=Branchiostoma belcheri TaxID=7741 RepID=A0A6P4YTD5_BRABE|nr:PREDICTED: probable serine/threonine-protein kinase DDB_G0283337 [Branchiostoma belcheri]